MNAYTLAATPAVLLTIAWPPLGLYLLGVASLVAIVCLALAGHRFRTERDNARDERDTARAESAAILAQAELLADELSHADKTIRNLAAQVASNVIPLQCTQSDSWLEAVIDEQMLRPDGGA